MRSISSGSRSARGARAGRLSAAERSALNQALARALAFRDAEKMPQTREWANPAPWYDQLQYPTTPPARSNPGQAPAR
jgi:hypothetical protein